MELNTILSLTKKIKEITNNLLKSWVIFLFSLLLIARAYPSSGYGVDVTLQSPFVQETDAGTIVTATFLTTNTSSNEENFLSLLKLPEGWISIPFDEPFFFLKEGSSIVQFIAFRVPPNARAGTYPIRYIVQGREHPSLISEASFSVEVLGKSSTTSYVEKTPSYSLAGDSYEISIRLVNTGNVETTVEVDVKDYMNFAISMDSPKEICLAPGESKNITIKVLTPISLEEQVKHFLSISVQNKTEKNSITYLSTEVEIFPRKTTKIERYRTLPMQTVFGYGMKNGEKQLFIEQSGKGSIGKEKNIDFFIRAPFISNVNVDRDLGGLPENGFLHYSDPFTDLYGGDGVYSLTPLTMLNRFGRGGALSIEPKPFLIKGLYVNDSSSVPESTFGGDLTYSPLSFLSFSLASMNTHFTKKSQKILDTQTNALTNSILGQFQHKKIGDLSVEYGDTGGFFSAKKNHQSYYFYSRASPARNLWYAIQNIYAEPDFVGYYQDTSQFYSSIGFPIVKKLQGTLSYNKIKYNLKKNYDRETAQKNHNAYGGLSYSFPFGLYTSLYYNQLHSIDSLRDVGYKTHFLSLNGGKSFKEWTLQSLIEYGRYYELNNIRPQRTWQNYQLYAYYQPSFKQQYAVYSRLGYVELSEKIEWAHIYGASLSLNATKKLNLQLIYEITDQKNTRHYLNTTTKYTFSNKTYLELKGYLNKHAKQSDTLEFLLSYTIPWNLPIGKNKSSGGIKGKISYNENIDSQTPASNLIVNCNGMKTLTDSKGQFAFPPLKPGNYHIWTEEKTQTRVSSVPLPLPILVQGGEVSNVTINFEHPCILSGQIPIFELQDTTFVPTNYLKNATLILESASTGKKIFVLTDANGSFSYDKLSSGRWRLTIQKEELPAYHYLEPKELLIDLFPGEDKTVEIKVLPIKRQLRIIDTDTIYTPGQS